MWTSGGRGNSQLKGREAGASEAHRGGQQGWSPVSEEESDKKGSEEPRQIGARSCANS